MRSVSISTHHVCLALVLGRHPLIVRSTKIVVVHPCSETWHVLRKVCSEVLVVCPWNHAHQIGHLRVLNVVLHAHGHLIIQVQMWGAHPSHLVRELWILALELRVVRHHKLLDDVKRRLLQFI